MVNTRRLNKALQDMLHNMDKFFERLLDKENYSDLLKEHLDGYVEEVVRKKYHILKTSDNFYIYKNDIKRCLQEMREDEEWIEKVRERSSAAGDKGDDVLDLLDLIERGFDDIEHRIANMDKEHSKYVRATVTRLNYLLSGGDRYQGADRSASEPDRVRRTEGGDASRCGREDEPVASGAPVREIAVQAASSEGGLYQQDGAGGRDGRS